MFILRWSIEALKQLKSSLPAGVIVDVLRQAAKSCVVKREFQKADLLIKEAIYLAREIFDTDHPKYSDVLIDYGFFLLNFDSISNSVTIYKVYIFRRFLQVFVTFSGDDCVKHSVLYFRLR